jgi:hypothetical protein
MRELTETEKLNFSSMTFPCLAWKTFSLSSVFLVVHLFCSAVGRWPAVYHSITSQGVLSPSFEALHDQIDLLREFRRVYKKNT